MVSKELFLVLIVFFSFLFFNLIIEKSNACTLCDVYTFNVPGIVPQTVVYEYSYSDSSCKTRID
ncbi:MAG: hypothetical protein KQA34_03230, partial [Candidatus Aenigmarchaeota archaeon]|nr:hypothetical protein [Candidatus Aenigmarchaeota archaeon]